MKLSFLFFLILPFISFRSVQTASSQSSKTTRFPTVKLLQVGSFHGDEVDRKDTALSWFGLFKSKTGFELKKVKVKIRYTRDLVLDDDNGGYTGKLVKINQKTEPLILIGGIDSLKEGKIAGKAGPNYVFMPGKFFNIKLKNIQYSLKASGDISPKGNDTFVKNYWIKLTNQSDKNRQVLYSGMEFAYDGPEIVWVGDIDGDGKPDLIVNECRYNGSVYALFLSSYATKGKLVRKMVVWSTIGC